MSLKLGTQHGGLYVGHAEVVSSDREIVPALRVHALAAQRPDAKF
jgi:hypothetical protein